MYIKQDMDFNDLMENCWIGAIYTLRAIEEHDKEKELMEHLEDIFGSYFNNIPTMTEVNDYLWFEDEAIFEALCISEDEEEEEKEEIDIDFAFYNGFDSFCEDSRCEDCPLHYLQGDCEQEFNRLKNA